MQTSGLQRREDYDVHTSSQRLVSKGDCRTIPAFNQHCAQCLTSGRTELVGGQGALYAQPSATDDTAEQIRDNPKFWPYFKDCIGALDGTHIHCIPPVDAISAFRNRKKGISQNVLAVCNFDMLFEYCLYGWEGSAHDGKVLTDALDKGLPIILGKYWLGDAGYALRSYCLTPYRGVRYHLKEWASIGERPQTK